jgi:hypothetical protein
VPVEADAAILDPLIQTRWLSEVDAGDARRVGEAIGALLRASARSS